MRSICWGVTLVPNMLHQWHPSIHSSKVWASRANFLVHNESVYEELGRGARVRERRVNPALSQIQSHVFNSPRVRSQLYRQRKQRHIITCCKRCGDLTFWDWLLWGALSQRWWISSTRVENRFFYMTLLMNDFWKYKGVRKLKELDLWSFDETTGWTFAIEVYRKSELPLPWVGLFPMKVFRL